MYHPCVYQTHFLGVWFSGPQSRASHLLSEKTVFCQSSISEETFAFAQFPTGTSSSIVFSHTLAEPEVTLPHHSFVNQNIKLFSADISKDLQSREQNSSSCKHSPKDRNTMC